MSLVHKDMLTNREILQCVLGGSVAFEGYRQYADARPYEFHIRIRDGNAHKMTAHMLALNKHRDEKKAKKEQIPQKSFTGGKFTSRYAKKTPEVNPDQTWDSVGNISFTVAHKGEHPTEKELIEGLLRRVGILMAETQMGTKPMAEAVEIDDTVEQIGTDTIDPELWEDLLDYYGV